jgi:hypothetical protein
MVAAWLEVLEVSGVPVEHYDSCYRAARQTQIELKAKGESVGPLGAEDLAVEWVKLAELHAEMQREEMKHRALPANAASACPKCYGTGLERMPNGSVRKGCQHEGWSPDFEDELERNEGARREEIRKGADFLKEALGKVGSPKPVANANAPKQIGVILGCTNEACKRKVNTLYGYEPGQTCSELLNRGVHDGPLKFCDGTLEKS